MKYLKTFEWRAISSNDFIATSDTGNFEYIIKSIGYKFQLRIRSKDNSLDILYIDFCRLHDAKQFAYEHYLQQDNLIANKAIIEDL